MPYTLLMRSSDEGCVPLIFHTLYELDTDTKIVDASCNQIRDFQGLERFIALEGICLDNNPIESFYGSVELSNLKWISLKQTPISKSPHLELMCLVAFGSQIEAINGTEVMDSIRVQADALRESIVGELRKGSLVTSLDPLSLSNVNEVSLEENSDTSEESEYSFKGRPLRKVVISRSRKFASDDEISGTEESSSHNISTSISSYTTESDECTEYEEETQESEKSYVIEYASTTEDSED